MAVGWVEAATEAVVALEEEWEAEWVEEWVEATAWEEGKWINSILP